MYKIGEFADLKRVTVKTLRYYDSIGLFKPAITDNYTGYRYYSEEQAKEFNIIQRYKDLGFSLEEIKTLINNDKEREIKKKINELTSEMIEDERKIKFLKRMLGNKLARVEYIPYKEPYAIGRKYTINSRDEIKEKLEEVRKDLEKLHIPYEYEVFANLELDYKEEDIDCLIGFTTSKEIDRDEIGDLKLLGPAPWYMCLVGRGKREDLEEIYKDMFTYAEDHNIQIRNFFTEKYDDDNVEIYVESFDLNEINEDYERYLDEYEPTKELDEELVGTYEIRDILPDDIFMANPNKQKSSLDTKYKELILKSNGTTNYENIKWNKKELVMEYDNRLIPRPIHKIEYNNEKYIIVLMNESYRYYKSQRPMSYIFKKVK